MRWHGGVTGKRGRGPKYSKAAIQFCLTMKSLYSLPLRQAMGMTQCLLRLAGLDWQAPGFDIVSRHLPRSRTFEPRSFRQSQRLALALPGAGCSDSVGEAVQGAPVLHGAGVVRALLPATWPTSKQTYRPCPAVAVDGQALGRRASHRSRRRQQFHGTGIAQCDVPQDLRRHPLATRCRPV